MTSCPPHFVRGHVRIMITLHRRLYDETPRRILVGLMKMAALEEIAGLRPPGSPLAINGIPVDVSSLEDRVCCVA